MIIKSINEINDLDLKGFSCGNKELDKCLIKYALINDHNGYGKTYLLVDEENIIGYFTLASASIKFEEYPINDSSLPKYPIPAIRLARLAVSTLYQNKGYGKELLKQALLRIVNVSDLIGIRIILVDAKEEAIKFYEHFGFNKLDNHNTYYLLIDTIKEAIRGE